MDLGYHTNLNRLVVNVGRSGGGGGGGYFQLKWEFV